MAWMIVKACISAAIIVAVSEIGQRSPRWGGFLLTLPVVSIIVILMMWFQSQDLKSISRLSQETLVLVPLGLPFFVPLALAYSFQWNFWVALAAGLLLASVTVGAWLLFGPTPS